MRFSTVTALLVSAAFVSAAQINVLVGNNGTLTFTPPSITAVVDDVIAFTFLSKNHTITQSTFASPCTNITSPMSGLDSGFVPVPPNATSFPQYSFTLKNASAPLWFYCRQSGHCQKGMVFAINPTAQKSFSAFQANAMGTATTTAVGGASGTASSTTASETATASSGAVRLVGSATGLLTLAGLVAGLTL